MCDHDEEDHIEDQIEDAEYRVHAGAFLVHWQATYAAQVV
jgi:hypothetical protein